MNRQIGVNVKKTGIFLILAVICLTGCAKSIKLEEEKKDLIVEYAADVVLKHDKDLSNHVLHETTKLQPESETTTAAITGGNPTEETTMEASNNNLSGQGGELQQESDVTTLNEAVSIAGLDIQYSGYTITKQYPDKVSNDTSVVMTPADKNRYLVMNLMVTNQTDKNLEVNIIGKEIKYRAILNGTEEVNAEIPIVVLNAFNTYSDTLKAKGKKTLSLVFEITKKQADSLNSLSLRVSGSAKDGIINLN